MSLDRFLKAQSDAYLSALQEIRRGRKVGHWMWFIYPQLRGLGSSPTSDFFGIQNVQEARAYLQHPLLGPRLVKVSSTLLDLQGRSAAEIFAYPDNLKLRSCMTLFAFVSDEPSVFDDVLKRYFDGQKDQRTLDLLSSQ